MGSTQTDIAQRTNRLAHHFFRDRGGVHGDDKADWYLADWMVGRLLPYLAIEAATDAQRLVADICAELGHGLLAGPGVMTMLIVLDGAPEYARECFREARRLSPHNGLDPRSWVEQKDRQFYRICHHVLRLHGSRVAEKTLPEAEAPNLASRHVDKRRLYQDACVSAFASEDAAPRAESELRKELRHRAIAAGIHLCRTLRRYNEERQLPWTRQLHARVVIAPSVRLAVSYLPFAWRDEIIVDPEGLRPLSPMELAPLLAAGIRPGPSSK